MDIWLTQEELDQLCAVPRQGREYDANWEQLRNERKPLIDLERTVKTQTPTLLEFDKHVSFTYRRWDGAHWHTELRNIDTKAPPALATEQRTLKDSIDTVLAVTHSTQKLSWYTPIDAQGRYDPRYQLCKDANNKWYCCIDNSIYSCSNSRAKADRGYTQHTFSTREPAVFNQHTLDKLLGELLGAHE